MFSTFHNNLDVKILFEGEDINDYKIIENRINNIIKLCRTELKVEPNSDEVLKLVWEKTPLYNKELR